jgi:hypothetical protein
VVLSWGRGQTNEQASFEQILYTGCRTLYTHTHTHMDARTYTHTLPPPPPLSLFDPCLTNKLHSKVPSCVITLISQCPMRHHAISSSWMVINRAYAVLNYTAFSTTDICMSSVHISRSKHTCTHTPPPQFHSGS